LKRDSPLEDYKLDNQLEMFNTVIPRNVVLRELRELDEDEHGLLDLRRRRRVKFEGVEEQALPSRSMFFMGVLLIGGLFVGWKLNQFSSNNNMKSLFRNI